MLRGLNMGPQPLSVQARVRLLLIDLTEQLISRPGDLRMPLHKDPQLHRPSPLERAYAYDPSLNT